MRLEDMSVELLVNLRHRNQTHLGEIDDSTEYAGLIRKQFSIIDAAIKNRGKAGEP